MTRRLARYQPGAPPEPRWSGDRPAPRPCRQHRTRSRQPPRPARCSPPRWHYLLFSLGFLAATAGLGLAAGWAAVHHDGLSGVLTEAACFAGAGALAAAGRGSFRGRIRRAMWRYPPPWLDNEEAEKAQSGTE
jgi:hypothetical protein